MTALTSGCAVKTMREPQSEKQLPTNRPAILSLNELDSQGRADFHFSAGEAQSLEGQHEDAIQQFRQALLFDPQSNSLKLRLAKEFVRAGQMGEALRLSVEVLEKEPQRKEAMLLSAGLYTSAHQYDKALDLYKRVLTTDPENIEAQVYVGALYVEQKQFKSALQFFNQLAANPNNTKPHTAYFYLARVYQDMNEKSSKLDAEKSYKKALELKPDYTDATISLAALYETLGKKEKALKVLLDFPQKYGPSPDISEQVARIYLENNQYQLAIEHLEVVESNESTNLNTKLKLAFALIETKRYREAISRLEEIVEKAPEADKIRFYLGAVFEEVQNFNGAIEHFVKIPPESQYYPDAVMHIAYLHKLGGRSEAAIKLIEKNESLLDDQAQLVALYASLLEEKKLYDKAQIYLQKGIEKFPLNTQLLFFLGSINERKGNLPFAFENLRKVIEIDPEHVQSLNFLAYLYAQNNQKLDQAEQLVRRALKIKPEDGYILDTLGWVLFKRGKIEEAVQTLEKAHAREAAEAIIAEHLGDAYIQAQVPEKAVEMYSRAAESERNVDNARKLREKISRLQTQITQRTDTQRNPANAP